MRSNSQFVNDFKYKCEQALLNRPKINASPKKIVVAKNKSTTNTHKNSSDVINNSENEIVLVQTKAKSLEGTSNSRNETVLAQLEENSFDSSDISDISSLNASIQQTNANTVPEISIEEFGKLLQQRLNSEKGLIEVYNEIKCAVTNRVTVKSIKHYYDYFGFSAIGNEYTKALKTAYYVTKSIIDYKNRVDECKSLREQLTSANKNCSELQLKLIQLEGEEKSLRLSSDSSVEELISPTGDLVSLFLKLAK